MSSLFEVLEHNGVASPSELLKQVHGWAPKRLFAFVDSLCESLFARENDHLSQAESDVGHYRFLAGHSIRGDFGCVAWECRLAKLQLLGRYAALYSDEVVMPIPIHLGHTSHKELRADVERSVLMAIELRPLIEAGIVTPVLPVIPLCSECKKQREREERAIRRSAKSYRDKHFEKFEVSYVPDEDGGPGCFILKGPDEFLEHGAILYLPRKRPVWLPKKTRNTSAKEVPLSKTSLRKSKFVDKIFSQLAESVVEQQFWGIGADLKYITSHPADIRFVQWLNDKNRSAARTAHLATRLAHSIPILTDLPLRTILKIRSNEHESFLLYRNAITRIVKDHFGGNNLPSDRDIRTIYEDVLRPQLIELERQVKNQRRAIRRSVVAKAAVPMAAVGIGYYSGLLPAELKQLFLAIGGLKAVSDVAETLTSLAEDPTVVRNHNLYFLLRLAREA